MLMTLLLVVVVFGKAFFKKLGNDNFALLMD
jgi:hypothetical protein